MMDFSKMLDARAFLAGVLLSFAGLSVAGWLATKENLFTDFHRSHQNIGAESLFYPTARQLVALVREKLLPDKISVILGGSSVFRGVGQSQDDLWSSKLQKELGVNFQVLNLALNGGSPGGQGLYMAEFLAKEGRKVIFVSNVTIGDGAVKDSGPTYPGFFFDAESRGYLEHFPERMARILGSLHSTDSAMLVENRIKANLNSYLNFNDLWSAIGYRYFFTVWTSLTIDKPWGSRRVLQDGEASCNPDTGYKKDPDREMYIMREFAKKQKAGDEYDHAVTTTIPTNIRSRTIFVVEHYSPYYVDKLTSSEKENYISAVENAVSHYQRVGITSVVLSQTYLAADFCDRPHFSSSGGQKLAASLAPYVKKKAKELGYE